MLPDKEIRRILQFDVKYCIKESQTKFRWVAPCSTDEKFNLQFEVSDGYFIDLVCSEESNFKNAGYGLFAARALPNDLLFSIY